MKNVTFSEKRDIEKVLFSGEVTQDNIVHIISSIAKYNLIIKNMSDEDNCTYITNWLKIHYHSYNKISIIKIFEKIGITILVISQNITDEFQNENSLYVVKENGVAKYLK